MTKATKSKLTKLGKIRASETPPPAPEKAAEDTVVATPASMIYRNIKALLLAALHPGAHAQHVAESVAALDQVIEAIEKPAAQTAAAAAPEGGAG